MKKTSKLIVASIIAASTIGLSSTLAWLVPIAKFSSSDALIDGTTEGAYYAYGEGTLENPYGISNQRHLYNLAWLQYLGTYDSQQFYFELADTIEGGILDMDGWTLPPIGTEDHPFIGNFDGKGKIIDGVVISNKFSDFNRFPSIVSQSSFNTNLPKVVGFFGVVGELDGNISYLDYNEQVNEFKNTGLSNITVRSNATETLVGVAAGYSDGNIANVAVEAPTVDIVQPNVVAFDETLTENLSDFGVVGYTTKKGNISKIDNDIYGVNVTSNIEFNAATAGTSDGWGGSVDMLDMYNKLRSVWSNFNSTHTSGGTDEFTYYTNKEITLEQNGSTTINSQTGANLNRIYGSEDGVFATSYNYYHGYYGYKQNDTADGNKETSSYTFLIEESSGDENYMQLSGKKEVKIPGVKQTLKTNYWDDFYGKKVYVDINSVRYYLKTNGSTDVNATTVEADGSLWEYENGYIFTNINGVSYYLNRSGTSTVSLSQSADTKWQYNATAGGYYTHYLAVNYYLNCTTTDWNLSQPSTVGYVLLSNGSGRYITHPSTNGNTGVGTSSTDTLARWYVAGEYFKTSATGTAYYLRNPYTTLVNNNSVTTQANLNVSSTNSNQFIVNDNYLYSTYTTSGRIHHVYVYYNGSAFTKTIATGTANPPANKTPIAVTKIEDTLTGAGQRNITFDSVTGAEVTTKKNKTELVDASFTTYNTFFPLRQKATDPGVPDDTNTGYVVSGANYWGDPYGDIRVSKYAKTGNLSSSTFSGGTLQTVYTIGSSNTRETVNPANFTKYTEAKTAMETVLNSDSYVYGLHFMNAQVNYGGPDPVIAEKAVINSTPFYNYELPTDSIDFSLKEKGYINFFAGTYYTGNNCFFSLHEIERDGGAIDKIKEIDGIYKDVNDTAGINSYVYKFMGGPGGIYNNTYSVPYKYVAGVKVNLDGTPYTEYSYTTSLPSGYQLAFSTSRIKTPPKLDDDFVFYFEIPMNEGEFCLGSVSGTGYNGAYLMYLDIAANAAKTQRTVFYEHFQETIRTFEYPFGVAVVQASTVTNGVVNPTDTVNVVIYEQYQGLLTITRTTLDTVYLERATGMDNNARPTLIGDSMWDETHEQYKLHDPGNNDENLTDQIVCEEVVRDVKRLQFFDYDVNKGNVMTTIITDTSINGGAYTRTLYQELPNGTIYEDDDDEEMRIYNQNTGTKYTVSDARNQSIITTTSPNGPTGLMIHLYYVQPNGVTTALTINLEAEHDSSIQNAFYYKFDDYLLEFTINDGSITILVVESGSGVIVVGNTTISAPGGTITIEP